PRPDEAPRHQRSADLDLRLRSKPGGAPRRRQRPVHPEQRHRAGHPGAGGAQPGDEERDRLQAVADEVEGSDGLPAGAPEMSRTRLCLRGLCGLRGLRGLCALCVLCSLCVLCAPPAQAAAQGRISNARTETRSAAQGLEREVRAAAARGGITWVGYRMPMTAGPRQMCCYDTIRDASDRDACCGMCQLERGSGVTMN